MRGKLSFPKIGQRIIRSVIAVALCFVVYEMRGRRGMPFYSALAVLQCMQQYQDSTLDMAKKRITGTLIGAAWGLELVLIQVYVLQRTYQDTMFEYLLISLFTGIVLYSTVVLGCKETAYFSSVVFLSIVVNHIGDEQPLLFICDRIFDTLLGVSLALIVNSAHLPRQKNRDILFVSGIDDTMMDPQSSLSPYSKIELNCMIDDGAKFTVSTMRTPASAREALEGVRMNVPIIAMDGAVLYDMNDRSYLMKYQMSVKEVKQLTDFLEEENVQVFTNTVTDDLLVIYYRSLSNEAERGIYNTRRKSPYRNYVHSEKQVYDNVVYLLLIDEKQKVDHLYEKLLAQSWAKEYRFVKADSQNYPGYAHIKIYHKDATREHMLQNLMAVMNCEKAVTFGSIEGKYDVWISDSRKDAMVRTLKNLYEPIGFPALN